MFSEKLNISNIRIKILLLTAFTLVPFVVLAYLVNRSQLDQEKQAKVTELRNIATLVALENKQITEGARQLLIALSATQKINLGGRECSIYISEVLGSYQRYGNFGVTDKTGNVICSGVQLREPQNLSDRYFYIQTKKTNSFTVGEYVVSRSTNLASLNFGYPLTNGGVVYATLNLDWLGKFISNLELDKDVTILVLDRKGVILARNPSIENWIGQIFPINDYFQNDSEGIFETKGIDGINRIYAYEQAGDGENEIFVLAGKTESEVFATPIVNFRKTLLFLLIATLVSIYAGVKLGNSLIAKSIEKIKELESLKRDFISLASHQIRTPVTAIKWFSEILLSKSPGSLTSKQEKIVKDTHLSAKRMIELISTILSVSKLESKRILIDPKPTSIHNLIKNSSRDVRKVYKNKKIHLTIKTSKNVPNKINIDEKLISQVFLNLIDNAFKYNHPGGKVLVKIDGNKKEIVVSISDTGIGIPKNELETLFQKFSRASNAKLKDTEGAGLGLYLAKLIVEAHGGNIRLASARSGTKIYFTIPQPNGNI